MHGKMEGRHKGRTGEYRRERQDNCFIPEKKINYVECPDCLVNFDLCDFLEASMGKVDTVTIHTAVNI